MQTANLISSLQTLNRSGKPLVIADTASNPVTQLEPGQRIRGTIQQQISPGIYKVQVGEQSLQMPLPGQLQNGSTIELQVVSIAPRLTFSLFASTNPLATLEQISTTSRLLANLTELPLGRTTVGSTSSKPVFQPVGLALDTKQLASALHDALAHSGLFYESHQAQWVRGERSTTQLLIEPQNQLANSDKLMPADATPIASDTALPIAKELVSVVQQQLHTLETHQLTWTGQVWPGQTMQWEIEGQPERHSTQQTDPRQWSTEMELALPKLGDVHVRLTFGQNGVKLKLHAADAESVALFNRQLPALAATMANAGVPLASSVIEKT